MSKLCGRGRPGSRDSSRSGFKVLVVSMPEPGAAGRIRQAMMLVLQSAEQADTPDSRVPEDPSGENAPPVEGRDDE